MTTPRSVTPSARRVLVWRSSWLLPSETFIRNQMEALRTWNAVPMGTRRIESAISSPSDVVVYAPGWIGKIRRKCFEATGHGRRVERAVLRADPDLIHAHFANDAVRILGYARRHRIPLVVTLHGNDVTGAPTGTSRRVRRYRRQLTELFGYSSRLIAVSEHIRASAIALGAPPERTVVHHIGVPARVGEDTALLRNGLLFVGRLVPKKGTEDLIRALGSLDSLRECKVDVVGDGPLRAELADLAARLGLSVHFHGTLSPADVKQLMREAEVVVVPSRTAPNGDTEGLPTVVMEAGACGAPVVAYRHAGIPDVIIHAETGLLVDEGDIAGLAQSISELIRSKDWARSLGKAAAMRVASTFNLERQTAGLERIYDDVLTSISHPKRSR